MAIITLNKDNDSLYVLVEKTDLIRKKEYGTIETYEREQVSSGHVLASGELPICMIRGER